MTGTQVSHVSSSAEFGSSGASVKLLFILPSSFFAFLQMISGANFSTAVQIGYMELMIIRSWIWQKRPEPSRTTGMAASAYTTNMERNSPRQRLPMPRRRYGASLGMAWSLASSTARQYRQVKVFSTMLRKKRLRFTQMRMSSQNISMRRRRRRSEICSSK
ncbi:hypothetical protein MPH_01866 [Macrophomina phaseolina MS6]|uniref:Uncharacterized protein n=1 Tax=Macrophomina phaseolina (strain MS6) TaxID=1126212 RepID=K2S7E7_MACPH|nr:hypothetical protein MPH_01866 [Macrophomina phaseolina MS6]